MKLSMTVDLEPQLRKLKQLQAKVIDQVAVRTVNKLADMGRAEMTRAIRGEFNIPASKVREKLFVGKVRRGTGKTLIEAELFSRDKSGRRRAINLINFAARETRKGLTVKIKRDGGRVIAAGRGFIGNKGRTAFTRVGDKRLPIRPLQTIDVPQMFNTRRVSQRVTKYLSAKQREVFERELAYAISQLGMR